MSNANLAVTEEWIAHFTALLAELEPLLALISEPQRRLAQAEVSGLRSLRDDLIRDRDALIARREAANAEANAAYAALRADPGAWAEVRAERDATGA